MFAFRTNEFILYLIYTLYMDTSGPTFPSGTGCLSGISAVFRHNRIQSRKKHPYTPPFSFLSNSPVIVYKINIPNSKGIFYTPLHLTLHSPDKIIPDVDQFSLFISEFPTKTRRPHQGFENPELSVDLFLQLSQKKLYKCVSKLN